MANTGKIIIKGIFYTILIVFLIILGLLLSNFLETSEDPTIIFFNYIPLLCFVGAGFVGLLLIFSIIDSVKESRSIGDIYQQGLLLLILVFTFIPLLSPIIDQGTNNHNFSVYNSYWNGCSDFKNTIENEGYEVMAIQSSLSATKRIENKSILLVMLGPNRLYNPVYEIPYFIDFFNGSNSILLCHDHGSSYELLWEIFFSNLLNPNAVDIPVTIFPRGYLRDNQSFAKNPLFPVLQASQFNDPGGHLTAGVEDVVLSKASAAAGGPLIPYFGWDVVANSSGVYSFVDKNNDKKYNFSDDNIDLSFMAPSLGGIDPDMLKLPLGYPFTPTVFLRKDMGDFRIFVSSDASLWNNELINHPDYDNKQLAINVINWLSHQDEGQSKDNWVIAIDEAHIRPENSNDISSAGIFGYLMRYIIQLSTNPLIAWIYPLLAIYSLRKFLPRDKEEKEQKEIERQEKREDKLRFRTSSFFAKKINWYHEKSKYRQALLLLYRRLERKLHAQLGERKITPKNVVEFVRAKEPDISRIKLKRIATFIDFILDLKSGGKDIKDNVTFEKYYYEMEWVLNNT
ncbi:MAG: hypothetical protein EU541_02020 [Promethearchaeota archaeon]|nr:MAG: hypothetical protein EU541_02020 [Candidatus Lokiarchaeota archaeon]